MSQRSVLICEEKHGSLYFVVEDDEDLFRTALIILKGRHRTGWFYGEPEEPEEEPLGFGEQDVDGMPASLRDEARKKLASRSRERRWYDQAKAQWDSILRAVKEEDGRLAWSLLCERSDHEYERIAVERARTEY